MSQLYEKWSKADKTTKEILTGVGLLIVFLAMMFYGSATIVAKISDGIVSARFFPNLVSGMGVGLSLLLITVNVVKKLLAKKVESQPKEMPVPATGPKYRWGMIGLSVVFAVVYLVLVHYLGFIISSILYLLAQILVLQKDKSLKKIIIVIIISIAVPLLIFLSFRFIFGLRMPIGTIFE